MNEKTMKLLTQKELVDPVNYILTYLCDDEIEMSVAQYYYARYKLALRNKNKEHAEAAFECYQIFSEE